MTKLNNSRKKTSTGYTLIELMMVVSIIAMLTSATLSILSDARNRANDTAATNAIHQTQTALGMYFLDKGSYPDSLTNTTFSGPNSKYINIIDKRLVYKTLNPLNKSACTGNNCQYYHLAVPVKTKVSVLKNDADLTPSNSGTTIYGNNSSDCVTSTGAGSADLCYDVTP